MTKRDLREGKSKVAWKLGALSTGTKDSGGKLSGGWSGFQENSAVSPGTKDGRDYFANEGDMSRQYAQAPLTAPFKDRSNELHASDSPLIPSIRHDPPSAPLAQIAPWAEPQDGPRTAALPHTDTFQSYSSEDSRSYHRPSTSRTTNSSADVAPWENDDNPMFGVSTTIASGSPIPEKKSIGRKLVGRIKGDEQKNGTSYPSHISKTPGLPPPQHNHSLRPRARTDVNNNNNQPPPKSDVVPWIYQDHTDIEHYGEAPVNAQPAGMDKSRYDSGLQAPASAGHSHHLHLHSPFHLHHHRHNKSKEEHAEAARSPFPNGLAPKGSNGSLPYPGSPQIITPRDRSPSGFARSNGNMTPSSPLATRSALNSARIASPLASARSANGGDGSPAEGPSSAKRSLFDRLRGKDKSSSEMLRNLPGSQRSLESNSGTSKFVKLDPVRPRRSRETSVATYDSGATIKASESGSKDASSRKESKVRLLGHGYGKALTPSRSRFADEDRLAPGTPVGESHWELDTNLDDMEGIVSANKLDTPLSALPTGKTMQDWETPDSWLSNRYGDTADSKRRESTEFEEDDSGVPHGLRVFRIDGTFATLSTGVNITAAEILQILGKKSFLQDDLNTYQIIMKKIDAQRQLSPGERPVAIQRHLLERAGYKANDGIEEIGRDDNSYLCRFTFVPTKITGYHSLDQNAGLDKITNFSHVDLAGCSLVTIPIALYKKASEIYGLDLSKNLALDVPKDFISSCTHLREIRFTGNESWQLPISFSLATKLTVLDISNNHLEALEPAGLHKLTHLASLKVANNKLKTLPAQFKDLNRLRNVNLSSNDFVDLPDVLYELASLADLDISFNAISTLPEIGRLSNLEKFAATNNQLTGSFADGLKDLENLREIDIRFNGIQSMDVISQCPNLEHLMIGHNKIAKFEGKFRKLKILHADHNPITRFDLKAPTPTLISLNLAAAQIAQLDDSLYDRIPNITKLILNKNLFTNISPQIGRLSKLEYLSISKNSLQTLPPTIGCLQELRYLDLHECNISKLPPEIWFCIRLDTLNLSSNLLEGFPRLSSSLQPPTLESPVNAQSSSKDTNGNPEGSAWSDGTHFRRMSQGSTSLLSVGSSPAASTRKNSVVSIYGQGGRKASVITRTPTADSTTAPLIRKDSSINARLTFTFAGSLKYLSMAENSLGDDVFEMICLLQELRSLNLSYNHIDDIPQNALRRWPNLVDLYLSGNNLTTLPTDDLTGIDNHSLATLHLNDNKFSNLPAELMKVRKLACLDIGSNNLKYNVTNWRYDWNWNFNQNLKYLNFSGNKRLEIKPAPNAYGNAGHGELKDLENFNSLQHLRILGLMDVTLTIPSIPDESADRRIRTSSTTVGSMKYGMSDCLGKDEHVSLIDLVKPKFRSRDTETLLGMFDGRSLPNQGSTIAKFLHENFPDVFANELNNIKETETAEDALRRAFLSLNKDLATAITMTNNNKAQKPAAMQQKGTLDGHALSNEDLTSGGVATVVFLDNMDLWVANVGDAQAMLIHSGGDYHMITTDHDPANDQERKRIRQAGGYVSRHGKLNDDLDVSRAFGYIKHIPSVVAAPSVQKHTLTEQDEMVLIASKELWEYIVPDLAIDVARSERNDLMRAAQHLRDLAIAFGATNKIMVMVVGVSDLKKRELSRTRTISVGPGSFHEDQVYAKRRPGRDPNAPLDSSLARLDKEILAPVGYLALVFTDIKSSTALWEQYPVAMRSAIKIHNEVLRRQLRIIGGYEVKTEGDAFMVAFPTATGALLWCFTVQSLLLNAAWPEEILDSIHGQAIADADENIIYRGLSVRMGAHWGDPVCEPDPITHRMDYFGQMVNKASRISSVADGGQITVSQDFINEIQKTLETYVEAERSNSATSEDTMIDEAIAQTIKRDLRALSTQGFEVKELGERKLKGLENPERVYLMYPHSLSARLTATTTAKPEADGVAPADPAVMEPDTQLMVDPESIWSLWNVSLRLEMLCSSLETPGLTKLRNPETGILERMKNRGGEVTDRVLIQFVDHLITRIEMSITALQVRTLVRPFVAGKPWLEQAAPMTEILQDLASQLTELRAYRRDAEAEFSTA